MKLTYKLNENKDGLMVTGGEGLEGELIIPSEHEINGKVYPVTKIGDKAFELCWGLRSVEIPDSVTKIGKSAFWGCELLSSVVIPDSVTKIGKQAFWGCKLSSVVIPDSVTEIDGRAFWHCVFLSSITIPKSVTKIGAGAFASCSALTSIVVDEENQYYDSRENCNAIIETKTNTLVAGCSTTVIPDTVTEIGESAFEDCSALISENTPAKSIFDISIRIFDFDVEEWVSQKQTRRIPIIIPDSVTKIADRAFEHCTGLTSIRIPESVIEIGELAFGGCWRLTDVIIPDSVTKIGEYAFSDCENLTGIFIPDSVSKIGIGAFSDCCSLASIVVGDGNCNYDSRGNCNAIIETATNILIAGCSATDIPDSVVEIAESAFSGCADLTSIEIPNSVIAIGDFAFSCCKNLESIEIPDSVTFIGNFAFDGCSKLRFIEIKDDSLLCSDDVPDYAIIVKS